MHDELSSQLDARQHFFFMVNLSDRHNDLPIQHVDFLREAFHRFIAKGDLAADWSCETDLAGTGERSD